LSKNSFTESRLKTDREGDMKKLLVILLFIGLCGCSGTQIRELFLPMSVYDFKNAKEKYGSTFEMEPSHCFEKTTDILQGMQARVIYSDPKGFFLVANRFDKSYRICIDTTQVGILITPTGSGKVRLEVASGDYDLAKFVSGELVGKLQEKK